MTPFERVESFCTYAPFEAVEAFLYDVLNRSYQQILRDFPPEHYRPGMNIQINSLDSLLAAREAIRRTVEVKGSGHFTDAIRSFEKFLDGNDPASDAENVAYRALRIAMKIGVGTDKEENAREEKELAQQLRWISRRRNEPLTKETLAAVDAYIADGLLIGDE